MGERVIDSERRLHKEVEESKTRVRERRDRCDPHHQPVARWLDGGKGSCESAAEMHTDSRACLEDDAFVLLATSPARQEGQSSRVFKDVTYALACTSRALEVL